MTITKLLLTAKCLLW